MSVDNGDRQATAAGVKLPYFHRVLSPEDQALIGDITPKPISATSSSSSSSTGISSAGSVSAVSKVQAAPASSGSAWNSANTWEEKDRSEWAIDNLASAFNEPFTIVTSIPTGGEGVEYVIERGAINVAGQASIAHVRGKARFMYELSFDLNCVVITSKDSYDAKISLADVINDQLDDMEVAVTWGADAPTSAGKVSGAQLIGLKHALLKNRTAMRDLKTAVIKRMKQFEESFRASYENNASQQR